MALGKKKEAKPQAEEKGGSALTLGEAESKPKPEEVRFKRSSAGITVISDSGSKIISDAAFDEGYKVKSEPKRS